MLIWIWSTYGKRKYVNLNRYIWCDAKDIPERQINRSYYNKHKELEPRAMKNDIILKIHHNLTVNSVDVQLFLTVFFFISIILLKNEFKIWHCSCFVFCMTWSRQEKNILWTPQSIYENTMKSWYTIKFKSISPKHKELMVNDNGGSLKFRFQQSENAWR